MAKVNVGIPQGTRDFGPEIVRKRNYIFDTIRNVFELYGFQPLETPAMENLETLMGKYGEEGDKLIFKILNNGLDNPSKHEQATADFEKVMEGKNIKGITERALRYDLTIPFARYVAMNHGQLSFPFKRYQMQPVWRGDKPQKGRYREFYQCDADVVGTDSLLCEAEIILMINEVLEKLGITDFTIKINNRKILEGIASVHGFGDKLTDLTVAIDKLDKIGPDKVVEELIGKGFNEGAQKVVDYFTEYQNKGSNEAKIAFFKEEFAKKNNAIGLKGVEEIEAIFNLFKAFGSNTKNNGNIEFDILLARGLSYYTGAIFEVKANNVSIGSISGGGRYDNLTGVFGLPGVSGVGISFGVDRIYDVMEELNLFPNNSKINTELLICCFDEEGIEYSLPLIYQFRAAGINSELYPEPAKMKKQLGYANDKAIPYVLLIGSEEIKTGKLTLKNMTNGQQNQLSGEEIILHLRA